eukprot:2033872-Prymnesium_polylepis.1
MGRRGALHRLARMYAARAPAASKWTSTYLPKRLELSLRSVRALPNASSTGLDWFSARCTLSPVAPPERAARNCSRIFVVSVLPAPDSPLTRIDWRWPPRMPHHAVFAMANGWGDAPPDSVMCAASESSE